MTIEVSGGKNNAKSTNFNISVSIEDLFDARVHYGHRSDLWNPKMRSYIFKKENGIHIINLAKTQKAMSNALFELYKAGMNHKRILFVGTKPQYAKLVKQYAIECGQYYVNHKWLGGTLANWKTISNLSKTLEKYERLVQKHALEYTKKELLVLTKKIGKLEKNIGGIRHLSGKPDIVFVVDTNMEHLAVKEASEVGSKVVAVVDTNSSPDNVDIVIPGNDDSVKAAELYLKLVSEAVLQGIRDGFANAKGPANAKTTSSQKKKNDSSAE